MFIQRKITQPYTHSIEISKPGLVAISISARCESKKWLSSRTDEDLRVEIDGLQFREIPPRKKVQRFNIPASWNGSKLKGLTKTIVFLIVLNGGKHNITFIPKDSAFIEDVEVEELGDRKDLEFDIEEQAEDGDRRPWYAFVSVDLPLKEIGAKTTIQYRWWDSDDVKIIIDNRIQRQKQPKVKLHRFWYWAGILAKKILRKQLTTKSKFITDLPKGNHYIEFWADKIPVLHWVELEFGEIEIPVFRKKARVIEKFANLREKPSTSSAVLARLKKGERLEILQKAIQGEVPYKEREDYANIWHKVKINEKEGFIFSKTVEIDGENEESIIQRIIEIAEELNFEIPLALAIAKTESQFFPYAVSQKEAKGLFQLTKIAQDEIKEEFDITNIFDINQNIEAGLRYFLKLKNHYYKDDPEDELKAIAAYRAGLSAIKIGIPLNRQELSKKTKGYLERVQEARKKFQKEYQEGKTKLKALLLFLGVVVMGAFIFAIFSQKFPLFQEETEMAKATATVQRQPTDEFGKLKKNLMVDMDGDKILDEVLFKENREKVRGLSLINIDVFFNGKFIHKASGEFYKAFSIDFEQDGKKEVVLRTISGQVGRTTIYYYQDNTLKVAKDIFSGFDNLEEESGISFVDEDDNGTIDYIILYNFDNPSDCLANSAEIYQYHQGKLIKFMEAKVDPYWCQLPYEFWEK